MKNKDSMVETTQTMTVKMNGRAISIKQLTSQNLGLCISFFPTSFQSFTHASAF